MAETFSFKSRKSIKKLLEFVLRNRKHEFSYENKNICVISFPKSGRTWLRVMLDRLHIGLSYSHDETSHAERIACGNLSRNKDKYKNKKVIFLVRDPRDIVVSGFFQAVKRIGVFNGSLSDFIRDERHGIRKILLFHEIWFNNQQVPKDFHPVRYEEMHADCMAVMRRIMEFLQLRDISDDQLRESIQFAEFENMKKLERDGFFSERYGSILSPADINDEESFKVRKGRIGGYVDYLNEEDIAYCNRLMSDPGSPFYR
jgi:hypothetical protein